MSRFKDLYLDRKIPSYPVTASPRWATEIIISDSGHESANQKWSQPLHRFNIPEAVRSMEIFESVLNHWMIMNGPAYTFPFRNPFDFSSRPLFSPANSPAPTPFDQTLGMGDGSRSTFQIIKKYERGAFFHNRNIVLPVVSSVRVAVDGIELLSGFSVDRLTGILTIDSPPSSGQPVTCGYYYDANVRFESDDSFDSIAQNYGVAGYSDLTLIETHMC